MFESTCLNRTISFYKTILILVFISLMPFFSRQNIMNKQTHLIGNSGSYSKMLLFVEPILSSYHSQLLPSFWCSKLPNAYLNEDGPTLDLNFLPNYKKFKRVQLILSVLRVKSIECTKLILLKNLSFKVADIMG